MSVFWERCQRVQARMRTMEIDWLLVPISADLVYLTGFRFLPLERLTLFMLPQSGRGTMLLPDFESQKLVREGLDIFYDVKTWTETDDPYVLVKDTLGAAPTTIAVGEQLWSMFLLRIQEVLSPLSQYRQGGRVVGPDRMRKDELEVAHLLEVGRRMDQVVESASKLRYSGRAELDVANDIFGIVRDAGLSPTRAGGVASGPNSASAHHTSGDRTIQAGDAVWLELGQGGSYRGYVADMTRNVHVGKPSAEYQAVHDVVKHAQDSAWRAVRPGLACQEVDRIARRIITAAGYGQYFTHRTGHGLGLDIHEPPYIVEGNTQQIQSGMVFSVEPGIYLPSKFGIRIEDIVIATDGGVQNLYKSTHDVSVVE